MKQKKTFRLQTENQLNI